MCVNLLCVKKRWFANHNDNQAVIALKRNYKSEHKFDWWWLKLFLYFHLKKMCIGFTIKSELVKCLTLTGKNSHV